LQSSGERTAAQWQESGLQATVSSNWLDFGDTFLEIIIGVMGQLFE
jgi:hypothetical protein